MKIATVLNIHSNPELVLDTIDSIFHYMTKDLLVIVDGASKEFKNITLPAVTLEGFYHGCNKAPYRNVALGLKMLDESFPDADWYCYIEYDCLVTSDRFKKNLRLADGMDVWMMGNDGHVDDKGMPFVSPLVGGKFESIYYLLGCCQFFSKKYMSKLREIHFFDRLLTLTNGFSNGFMPGYSGYDLSEHMYPTIARHFGGNIGVFATWERAKEKWHGSYEIFPMRFQPELDPVKENFPEASIMHPLKSINHPIRVEHRLRRKNVVRTI